jgi:hypothetical protein
VQLRRAIIAVLFAFVCVGVSGLPPIFAATSVARLNPPSDGQSYFGFTFRLWDTQDPAWGDIRPFSERIDDSIRTELGSKRPTLLTVWAGWQEASDHPGMPLVPFSARMADVRKVESVVGPTGFVALDWTLTSTTATNGGITTKDVASGALDEYIRRYAQEVKAYGRPVLIRLFGGEFNGSWWYGVSPRANPNLTSADFVAAWRRVVGIFHEVGAANASWSWVPNAHPPESVPWVDPDIGAYYPGDDYVDWAGGDAYDVGPASWLDGPYAFAVAHGKPFFLAEWGVRHDGSILSPSQQRDWLEAMFDYIESRPAIKAVSYFNYNNRVGGSVPIDPARTVFLYDGKVNYQANVNDLDHRLLADSGAGFRTAFARRIASQRYVSAATMTTTAAPQTATAVIVSVHVRGRVATIGWRGNSVAHSYDVSVRRAPAAWRTVASRLDSNSYRLRGKPGTKVQIRVRGRDASGNAGPWSSARTIRFP